MTSEKSKTEVYYESVFDSRSGRGDRLDAEVSHEPYFARRIGDLSRENIGRQCAWRIFDRHYRSTGLMSGGHLAMALGYVALSVILCIAAVFAAEAMVGGI